MSIEALAWALKLTGLPPRDKYVLLVLANYYNQDECAAWMKQGTLSDRTGFSRATVNRALQDLEHKHGLITSTGRKYPDGRRASNVYRIPALEPAAPAAPPPDRAEPDRVHVAESYTDHVAESYTDHVAESYNKNLEHRTPNIEPPPLRKTRPPKPRATIDEEAEALNLEDPTPTLDLTHRQRTTLKLGPDGQTDSHLMTFSPATFKTLVTFKRLHGPKANDEMFRTWSREAWRDVQAHGEPLVIDALEAAIGNFPALSYPWSFYRACLAGAAKKPKPTADEPPARMTQAEVDEMVEKAMKGIL